jgi:hypothetical protein
MEFSIYPINYFTEFAEIRFGTIVLIYFSVSIYLNKCNKLQRTRRKFYVLYTCILCTMYCIMEYTFSKRVTTSSSIVYIVTEFTLVLFGTILITDMSEMWLLSSFAIQFSVTPLIKAILSVTLLYKYHSIGLLD